MGSFCRNLMHAPPLAGALATSGSPALLGSFWRLTLAQTNARAAAVLVNEFDTRGLKCASYDVERSVARPASSSLELLDRHHRDPRTAC